MQLNKTFYINVKKKYIQNKIYIHVYYSKPEDSTNILLNYLIILLSNNLSCKNYSYTRL